MKTAKTLIVLVISVSAASCSMLGAMLPGMGG